MLKSALASGTPSRVQWTSTWNSEFNLETRGGSTASGWLSIKHEYVPPSIIFKIGRITSSCEQSTEPEREGRERERV